MISTYANVDTPVTLRNCDVIVLTPTSPALISTAARVDIPETFSLSSSIVPNISTFALISKSLTNVETPVT